MTLCNSSKNCIFCTDRGVGGKYRILESCFYHFLLTNAFVMVVWTIYYYVLKEAHFILDISTSFTNQVKSLPLKNLLIPNCTDLSDGGF